MPVVLQQPLHLTVNAVPTAPAALPLLLLLSQHVPLRQEL